MYTVRQIADALGAACEGDVSIEVARTAEPQDAGPGDLALATSPKYAEALAEGAAQVAMLWVLHRLEKLGAGGSLIVGVRDTAHAEENSLLLDESFKLSDAEADALTEIVHFYLWY